MDLLYGGQPYTYISYYFEIDIRKTYQMMHNNDPAELKEYA